jgi:hypothetical protein
MHRHKIRPPIFKDEYLKIDVFWDVMPRKWPAVPDISKYQSTFTFMVSRSPYGAWGPR